MVNIRKCRTIRQAGSVEQASWKKRIAPCLDWREDTALAARQGLSAKSGLANVKWINPPSLSMPMCTLLPNHLYFYYITPLFMIVFLCGISLIHIRLLLFALPKKCIIQKDEVIRKPRRKTE